MSESLIPTRVKEVVADRLAAVQQYCGQYIIFTRDLGRQEYIVSVQATGAFFCPGQKLAWKIEPIGNPHEQEMFQAAGWKLKSDTQGDGSGDVALRAFGLVTAEGQVRPFYHFTDNGRRARIEELLSLILVDVEEAADYYAKRLARLGVVMDDEGQPQEDESRLLWENHARIVTGMISGRFPHTRIDVPGWFARGA